METKTPRQVRGVFAFTVLCPGPDLNRHGILLPGDFKSPAYTNFATRAYNSMNNI